MKQNTRRFHHRRLIVFLLFAFAFTAALAFLSTSHQDHTEAASTSGFKAGNIISDAVMTDYNSMTVKEIQSFLKSKNSCNKSADLQSTGALRYEDVKETQYGITYNRRYYYKTASGTTTSGLYHVKNNKFVCLADETINGQSAAYIIWDAAQTFKINPKVLIVLLEKEQGLITDQWPYHIQYRSATGYGCPDSAACDSKYYGLEAQVGNAAYLFSKIVYENKYNLYPVGNNYVKYNYNSACGGSTIKIENRSTGALYTYTPYQPNAASLAAGYGLASGGCGAYGNRNFYLYYSDWFGDPRSGASYNTVTVSEKLPALDSLKTTPYQISSLSDSKKAIDISGGVSSSSKSGKLINYTKRVNSILNQSFVFKYDETEQYYYIENPTSGLRFDVSGASTSDGAEVLLWTAHIGCNQKWTIKEIKEGNYAILSACSNKALTVEKDHLVIRKYTGANNQLWTVSDIPTESISFGNGDKYQILNSAKPTLSIDLSGGIHSWKKNYEGILYEARSSNNANQTFSFEYDEATDSFRIVNPATNLSLDVSGSKSADGTRVLLWQSHSHCNQKWKLTKSTDGLYTISSLCNNKPLTTLSKTPASMSELVIFNRTDNTTKWQIKKI